MVYGVPLHGQVALRYGKFARPFTTTVVVLFLSFFIVSKLWIYASPPPSSVRNVLAENRGSNVSMKGARAGRQRGLHQQVNAAPIIRFDSTYFHGMGISTVRLYVIAAAAIAYRQNVKFMLPSFGVDHHLDYTHDTADDNKQFGKIARVKFSHYFDVETFIEQCRLSLGLEVVEDFNVSCVWHTVYLDTAEAIRPGYLRQTYATSHCLDVSSFPSMGLYTDDEMRWVRQQLVAILKPSSRLRHVIDVIKQKLPATYAAVYVRTGEDWRKMCSENILTNCFIELGAYIIKTKQTVAEGTAVVLLGKAGKNRSITTSFEGEGYRSITVTQLLRGLAKTVWLGEHDLAIVEAELAQTATTFIGNVLSSFCFIVRSALIGRCKRDVRCCVAAFVVNENLSGCDSQILESFCPAEQQLFVSGCSNSDGLEFIACWSDVLLGRSFDPKSNKTARRVKELWRHVLHN